MKTTTTMTLYGRMKNVARTALITVGTLMVVAYVLLFAVIIIL